MSPENDHRLPEEFADVLAAQPETGMGYWVASVRLRDGRRFDRVVINGGLVTQVHGFSDVPFQPSQVVELWVTHDKWNFNAPVSLRRFWFRIIEGCGIGVTAYTEREARGLAEQAAEQHGLNFEVSEVVADVDIRNLDQEHVIPNMGPPNVRGVWFPRCNL
jgi:hypothetical protein